MSFQQCNKIRKSRTFSQKMNEDMYNSVAVIRFKCKRLGKFLADEFNNGKLFTIQTADEANFTLPFDFFKRFECSYLNRSYTFNEFKYFRHVKILKKKVKEQYAASEYLTEITLPDTMVKIPGYMFNCFNRLKKVILPDAVEEIGQCAFFRTSIKEITFPEVLKTIRCSAFYGTQLEHIVIPNSVKRIEFDAFAYNDNLLSVELKCSRKSLVHGSKEYIKGSQFDSCPHLEKIVFSGKLLSIPEFCFEETASLKHIELPESLEEMHEACFANSGLKSIRIPKKCKKIDEGIFYNTDLEEIEICSDLKEFPEHMFNNCFYIKKLKIHSKIVFRETSFEKNTYDDLGIKTKLEFDIYVPEKYRDFYSDETNPVHLWTKKLIFF